MGVAVERTGHRGGAAQCAAGSPPPCPPTRWSRSPPNSGTHQASSSPTPQLLAQWVQVFGNPLTWGDLPWLRSLTDLPLIVKGIGHPEDARRAKDGGVAASTAPTTAAGNPTRPRDAVGAGHDARIAADIPWGGCFIPLVRPVSRWSSS
ncbi:alpha-hydroxy-acid oxidizing protein [Amycolatopsis sp. NPDC051128]|uniref:alpha-hydroxy-acid oxidizing protein n=1 Tax=Amycolatopsis sp. NPDC051128 TaxID=3155412 RepID=UPI003417C214